MAGRHVDVLIVGAGISGIGAACHLARESPGKSYAILERRSAVGGTWDLFRYPGIRSDSDMYTFGYRFRPWRDARMLADGPSIRAYVEATAAEYGVTEHIRFAVRVTSARWSGEQARWSVETRDEETGEVERRTCGFLIWGTGYYDFDSGYRPDFPGEDRFQGQIVHPQHWPADLDHRGKRIVVIGSGATAVTLVPALAEEAEQVTMLQRSPTYILSLPGEDRVSAALRTVLPARTLYRLARGRNIAVQRGIYALARWRPDAVRRLVLAGVRRHLGPDAELRDFTPEYDPWDQRLCVIPDGDLFRAMRRGRARVVTDEIDTFTESGLRLKSGEELAADLVVTATGLEIQLFGGAELVVDGTPVRVGRAVTYKGAMLEGVPNAAMVFGYTNASWTLKADLVCEYVCRLINHMDARGYRQVVARAADGDRESGSMMSSLNSGYVRRGNDRLPRQGTRRPWRVSNDYLRDAPMLRHARIEDGILEFSRGRTGPDRPNDAGVAAGAEVAPA
jgi:cation diffusion facilitator CzcD-associated flavoprotein CzcO